MICYKNNRATQETGIDSQTMKDNLSDLTQTRKTRLHPRKIIYRFGMRRKGDKLMARITKPVEVRRQEIIDTARELFLEHGFDKTQMSDILKKMNVATGTIYHYFKSKTEILYAVIDELMNEKIMNKRQLLNEIQGSALDRLKYIFSIFENSELHSKTSSNFLNDPATIQYYMTKMSNSYLTLLVPIIEQGNADGSWNCEYPTETAVFILQGIAGVMAIEHERKDSSEETSKRLMAYKTFAFRVLGVAKSS